MPLPAVRDRIEMFLSALAGRCKQCLSKGRCDMCYSLEANRLLADLKMEKAMSFANRPRSVLTSVEESILVQLSGAREVRGDFLHLPYKLSVQEKKGVLRRLVSRGLIECDKRIIGNRERNFYRLPR